MYNIIEYKVRTCYLHSLCLNLFYCIESYMNLFEFEIIKYLSVEVFVYSLISAGLHSYMLTLHKWGQLISFWQKTRANSRTFGGSPLLKVFQRELAWPSVNLLGFLFFNTVPSAVLGAHSGKPFSIFRADTLLKDISSTRKCRWALLPKKV